MEKETKYYINTCTQTIYSSKKISSFFLFKAILKIDTKYWLTLEKSLNSSQSRIMKVKVEVKEFGLLTCLTKNSTLRHSYKQ